MKALIISIMLYLPISVAFGQQIATTEDGKNVVLKSDGTWAYKDPDSPSSSDYDFRKVMWGMSLKDVKTSEKSELVKETQDLLVYSGSVAYLDAFIVYIFVDNKLVRTKYSFISKHTNNNEYIIDFKSINSTIAEKYGPPNSENEYWSQDLYKGDKDHIGMAISVGHLKYYTTWNLPNHTITAALTGDNFEINHVVEYSSTKYAALEDRKNMEKKKSEF